MQGRKAWAQSMGHGEAQGTHADRGRRLIATRSAADERYLSGRTEELFVFARHATFTKPDRFADSIAQEVKFGAPDDAVSFDDDLVDARRVERKLALDALPLERCAAR